MDDRDGAGSPRIDAIGLVAADVAATVAFYTRLGVRFDSAAAAGGGHVEGDLGGMRLMVDSHAMLVGLGLADAAPPSRDRPRDGMSLAVRCSSPAAVDELYASLDADGCGVLPPWDAPWGQRYAVVSDPDGTQVDLYAPSDPPPDDTPPTDSQAAHSTPPDPAATDPGATDRPTQG